jgi:hypothetical protein
MSRRNELRASGSAKDPSTAVQQALACFIEGLGQLARVTAACYRYVALLAATATSDRLRDRFQDLASHRARTRGDCYSNCRAALIRHGAEDDHFQVPLGAGLQRDPP